VTALQTESTCQGPPGFLCVATIINLYPPELLKRPDGMTRRPVQQAGLRFRCLQSLFSFWFIPYFASVGASLPGHSGIPKIAL
jgi:hypothetical protein